MPEWTMANVEKLLKPIVFSCRVEIFKRRDFGQSEDQTRFMFLKTIKNLKSKKNSNCTKGCFVVMHS